MISDIQQDTLRKAVIGTLMSIVDTKKVMNVRGVELKGSNVAQSIEVDEDSFIKYTLIRTYGDQIKRHDISQHLWSSDKFSVEVNTSVIRGHDAFDHRKWVIDRNNHGIYLALLLGLDNLYMNQYEYMDLYLEAFWMEALGKTLDQTYSSGISTAHGDKCYSYRHDWAKAKVPFNHGACIFMLSYIGTVFGHDRPRHTVHDWVIEQYPVYKPMLEAVEEEFEKLLRDVYTKNMFI